MQLRYGFQSRSQFNAKVRQNKISILVCICVSFFRILLFSNTFRVFLAAIVWGRAMFSQLENIRTVSSIQPKHRNSAQHFVPSLSITQTQERKLSNETWSRTIFIRMLVKTSVVRKYSPRRNNDSNETTPMTWHVEPWAQNVWKVFSPAIVAGCSEPRLAPRAQTCNPNSFASLVLSSAWWSCCPQFANVSAFSMAFEGAAVGNLEISFEPL